MNLKAGFLHKLADALGSVAVIAAGIAILVWGVSWVDAAVTALIAGYILWQSFRLMGDAISILMESTPKDIDLDAVVDAMRQVESVEDVHHIHVWELDEQHRALEAHVVVRKQDVSGIDRLKSSLKSRLQDRFRISHSTLEFDFADVERDHLHRDPGLIHQFDK